MEDTADKKNKKKQPGIVIVAVSRLSHQCISLDPLDGLRPGPFVRRCTLAAQRDDVAARVHELRPQPKRRRPTAAATSRAQRNQQKADRASRFPESD